ncbi:hypothetical protein Lal_00013220 [Lupinus albus]|nr:hypothetical protein Lal_00013220 [Lupinus albus]
MAMNVHALRKLLAAMEAEEAGQKTTNYGTSGSFNNHGGDQNFSGSRINSGANSGDRYNRQKTTNYGTSGSFNNHGGDQNFSGSRINSGANSGDRYNRQTYDNHGGSSVNNSGTFNGNGNGANIAGNFDASTWNHRY